MYKSILTAVTILSVSPAVLADNSEVWKCVNPTTLEAKESCLATTFEAGIDNDKFFKQLPAFSVQPKHDAFATVTYFPSKGLIEVKSLEGKSKNSESVLIASR